MKDPGSTKHARKIAKKENKTKVVKSFSEAVLKLKKMKQAATNSMTSSSTSVNNKLQKKSPGAGWKAKKGLVSTNNNSKSKGEGKTYTTTTTKKKSNNGSGGGGGEGGSAKAKKPYSKTAKVITASTEDSNSATAKKEYVKKPKQQQQQFKDKSATTSNAGGNGKGFVPFSNKRKSPDALSNTGTGGKVSTSTEKDLKKQRQSLKPNFELIERLKSDWNKVRDRATSPELKTSLINSMLGRIEGRIVEITLRHDASRVIQYLLQHGSPTQRQKIVLELVTKAVEICKTPYGHFAILKAVTYCTDTADRKKLLGCLSGHFVAVGGNVIGARTVESIMQLLPPKLTRPLKAEFYGRKFVTLLPESPMNLRSLIEQLPAKEMPILDHMKDLLQRFVDKGLLEFTYVHNLIWEYTQEILDKPTYMNDLISQLQDAAPKLMSTKPGAKVICVVATYGGAKERKRLLKSLKGKVLESLLHTSAHLSIMRIVDVTDDTVNVQKSLFDEINSTEPIVKYRADGEIVGTPLPALISIAKHYFGRKFLLRLLHPSRRHLEPDEELLFDANVATSKKNPENRRLEHLAYLKHSLLAVCVNDAETLLRCQIGHKVLEEVIQCFYPIDVLNAIVKVCTYQEVEKVVGDIQNSNSNDEEEEDNYDNNEDGDNNEGEPVVADDEEGEGEGEGEQEREEFEDFEEESPLSPDEEATAVPAATVEVLAIEEDLNAHQVLRSLLQLEIRMEGGTLSDTNKAAMYTAPTTPIEKALWVDGETSTAIFAPMLLQALIDNSLLEVWVAKNRSCFALADMLHIPSVGPLLITALKPLLPLIEDSAKAHKGGELLFAAINNATATSTANVKAKGTAKKIKPAQKE